MGKWEFQLYAFNIDENSDDAYSEQMIEQLNDWGEQGSEAVSLIYLWGEKRPGAHAEKAKELRAADRTGKAIGARSKQEILEPIKGGRLPDFPLRRLTK